MNRRIVDNAFPIFFTRENTKTLLNLSTEMPKNEALDIHKSQWLLSELYGLTYIINLQNQGLQEFKRNVEKLIQLIDKQTQNK